MFSNNPDISNEEQKEIDAFNQRIEVIASLKQKMMNRYSVLRGRAFEEMSGCDREIESELLSYFDYNEMQFMYLFEAIEEMRNDILSIKNKTSQ